MAVSTGFRQPCPSCEAMVPIKDSTLVGKKIDCPKCKYRFIVESPAVDDADEDDDKPATKTAAKASSRGKPLPRRDDDEDDRPRKKGGGNSMLLIGGGLGVAAALLLAVFYFTGMFGGETKTTPPPPPVANNNTPRGEGARGETAKGGETAKTENTGGETAKTENTGNTEAGTGATASTGREITNMLPNDTQTIFSLNMHNFEVSPFGKNLFDPASKTVEFVEANLGVKPSDINRVVCAGHATAGWSFCVMQAKTPFDPKKVVNALCKDSTPVKDKGGKYVYFLLKSNPLLECLGAYAEGMMEDQKLPLFQASEGRKFAAFVADTQTVVVADESAMVKFLADNLQPKLQSTLNTDPNAANEPPPEGAPSGGGRGGRGGVEGLKPTGGEGGERRGGIGAGPVTTTNGTYLTIKPIIKSMMNRLEENEKDVVMSAAFQLDLGLFGSLGGALISGAIGGGKVDQKGQRTDFAPVVGAIMSKLDAKKGVAKAYLEMDIKDDVAQKIAESLKAEKRPEIVQFLESKLGIKIDTAGAAQGGGAGGLTPAGGERTPGRSAPIGGESIGGQLLMQRPQPGGEGGIGGAPSSGGTTSPSTVVIGSNGRVINLSIDLDWSSSYNRTVAGYFESLIEQERSRSVLLAARAHWTSLAKGLAAFKAKGEFPKGAYPRRTNPERYNLPFAPEQRVGWMAQLLPSLGYDNIYRSIDFELSWNHESNLRPASRWIPEFLSPSQPEQSWRAELPSVGGKQLGATHFIGLSGIGLDAADFPDTPEYAKKLGIFGYNRETKYADIVAGDGAANTIFMVQVSALIPRPWIRGGGATVQGVPETDSFLPFSVSQGDLRFGSYAVMADGSVRFINGNVAPEVFKALVTYKGGEKIDNLNAVAPLEEAQKLDKQGMKRNLKQGISGIASTWETHNLEEVFMKVQTPGRIEKQPGLAEVFYAAPSIENPLYTVHLVAVDTKTVKLQEEGDNQADLDTMIGVFASNGMKPEKVQKVTVGRKNARRFEISTSAGQFYNQLFIIAGKPVVMEVKKNTVTEADMTKFFSSAIIDEPKIVRGWQKLEVALGGLTAEAEIPGRPRRLTSPSDTFNNIWSVRVGDSKTPASFEIEVRGGPEYGLNDFGGKAADAFIQQQRDRGVEIFDVKSARIGEFEGRSYRLDYKTKQKDPMNNNAEKEVEHKDMARIFILSGKIAIFRVKEHERAKEADIKRFFDSAKLSR